MPLGTLLSYFYYSVIRWKFIFKNKQNNPAVKVKNYIMGFKIRYLYNSYSRQSCHIIIRLLSAGEKRSDIFQFLFRWLLNKENVANIFLLHFDTKHVQYGFTFEACTGITPIPLPFPKNQIH